MENSNEITVVNTEQTVALQSPEPYISETELKRQKMFQVFGEREVLAAELLKDTRMLTANNTVEAILAISVFAKPFGIPMQQALLSDMLYYMNGKVCLQGKGLAALIFRAGHSYRVIRDFAELYVTDNPDHDFLTGEKKKIQDSKGVDILQRVYFDHPVTKERTVERITTIKAWRKGESEAQITSIKLSELLATYEKNEKSITRVEKYIKHHMLWKCVAMVAKQIYADTICGFELMDDRANMMAEKGINMLPNDDGVYTEIK